MSTQKLYDRKARVYKSEVSEVQFPPIAKCQWYNFMW